MKTGTLTQVPVPMTSYASPFMLLLFDVFLLAVDETIEY